LEFHIYFTDITVLFAFQKYYRISERLHEIKELIQTCKMAIELDRKRNRYKERECKKPKTVRNFTTPNTHSLSKALLDVI
jgi:hypothetical protein